MIVDDCAVKTREKKKTFIKNCEFLFEFVSINYLIHIYLIIREEYTRKNVVVDI